MQKSANDLWVLFGTCCVIFLLISAYCKLLHHHSKTAYLRSYMYIYDFVKNSGALIQFPYGSPNHMLGNSVNTSFPSFLFYPKLYNACIFIKPYYPLKHIIPTATAVSYFSSLLSPPEYPSFRQSIPRRPTNDTLALAGSPMSYSKSSTGEAILSSCHFSDFQVDSPP